MNRSRCLSLLTAACLTSAFTHVEAYSLVETDQVTLNADIEIALAAFSIDKNFNGKPSGSAWQEGYAKYGFNGEWQAIGTYYAALNVVSSGTWGDGDPSGLTIGNERHTDIEDMYLGWRISKEFSGIEKDILDISAGRRVITIGDGFIINDDGLNMGNGIDPSLNRGGAYYLAARHAFYKTATINLSITKNLRGDLIYFKTNNRAQANTGMYAANVEYTVDIGTLGFAWIHGKDVDSRFADDFQMQRKGMNVYSLRGSGNAGVDNLFLSFELARQYRDQIASGIRTGLNDNATAGYAEIGWTFSDKILSPTLTYRYSHYSETWDSLFSGLNRGFGTWFQGEVAANYAGPFNNNTHIQHLGLKLNPSDTLNIGLLYFDFSPVKRNGIDDLGGVELDAYAEWTVNQNMMLVPLLGLYRPDKDQNNGGVQQSGGNNLYSQLMLIFNF